jgi:hypothetical protein
MGPLPKLFRLPPCGLFGWIKGEEPEPVDGVPLAENANGVPKALAGMLKEPGWPCCWEDGAERGGTKPR